MRKHLNTLFVTLEDAYLRKDGAAVEVRHDGESKLRIPLHNLESICTFGWNTVASASLMHACAEAKVGLAFHSPYGKFLASSQGPQSGNVLLRRAQYKTAESESASLAVASHCVAAKIANCRTVLMRASRDHGEKDPARAHTLQQASDALSHRVRLAEQATSLEILRGVEGDSATAYFAAMPHLIVNAEEGMTFNGRSRRPPLDPVNALLSFFYSLLAHDVRSACESVGLDPQCGFLHRDRPGRPSLALDIMEEFRAFLADRAALTLLNRQQIHKKDFEFHESGAVTLKEDARKTVLKHWQERKQKEIMHPYLMEKTTIGLLPFIQARLLVRCLRNNLDAYPAFLAKG